jgi:hypothetical protein
MELEDNEARNDCAGEDQQQFNPPTNQSAGSLQLVLRRMGSQSEVSASLRQRDAARSQWPRVRL